MVNGGGDGATLALDVADADKNDTKKRRFLRGLRRMFRRRAPRGSADPAEGPGRGAAEGRGEPPTPTTARLIAMEDGHRRKSGSAHQSGLSVSHDSVFTAEASGASGADSDEERARSTSSASDRRRRHHHHHHHHNHGMATPLTAELAAAVRRRARGDTSEEDEDLGLPRSPPASPPKRGNSIGGGVGRAEQSSCSEGSLLSAGSSDPEDESRSSRGDLTQSTLDTSDPDGSEPPSGLAPLSHSAARHKMAVRPRRTHGAPRRNRNKQMSPGTALPTTPEVNEEITRSITPEVITARHHSADSMTSSSVQHSSSVTSNTRHIITTSNMRYEKTETSQYSSTVSPTADLMPTHVSKETRHKSSSLPPGLALSQMVGQYGLSPMKLSLSSNEELTQSVKIGRSKSNAQKKDSDETDENVPFNDPQQSLSERNLALHHGAGQGMPMCKSMDMKFNVLAGELQKRFGSVGEEEELLTSGNFESMRPDVKYRKNGDKTFDKSERYVENITQHNVISEKSQSKNKYQELDEPHEKQANKKEESFFGRLLLRRSGKKNKKDSHNEKDEQIEEIKKQSTKEQQSFKTYSSEQSSTITAKSSVAEHAVVRHHKMMCSDQHAHKSIGQKVFSNQNHKRIDPRGGYVNDPILQESMTNYSKGSATEHGINDLKHFADREKLSSEMQFQQSSLKPKDDVNLRRLSSENISKSGVAQQSRTRQRMEAMDIPSSPEPQRKPPILPRTSSQESKGFFPSINQAKVYPAKEVVNGGRYTKNHQQSKMLSPSDDLQFPQATSPKIKTNSENMFGFISAATSPTVKCADVSMKPLSYSVSPPRSVWPHNYDPNVEFKSSSQGSLDPQNIRNSKSDFETRYFDYSNQKSDYDIEVSKARPKIAGLSSYQQKISQIGSRLDSDALLSFSESASSRNPVVKSHSFRLNSDVVPMASQQDMPSLPPMFGISESSIDSWESTYKKNIKEINEAPTSLELGSDSLMNFNYKSNSIAVDENFTETDVFAIQSIPNSKDELLIVTSGMDDTLKLDSYLKNPKQQSLYTKNITSRSIKARDDISRIEANIDNIIGSPKPLNCITLKSSSLDSVKSFTEKSTEQNRKAYSNESISNNKVYLNQPAIPEIVGSVSFNQKISPDASTASLTSDEIKITTDLMNNVSVTVLNISDGSVSTPILKTPDPIKSQSMHFDFTSADKTIPKVQVVQKDTKGFDKLSPTTQSSIPEFMKIQLNKVDQKPISNVVLSTGAMNQINDHKSMKTPIKTDASNDINSVPTQHAVKKSETIERSISYEPKKSERFVGNELKKSESSDKNTNIETKELIKPHRKFSSEDVEILEKSDLNLQNNAYNIQLKKTGSQTLLNRSTEMLTQDNSATVPTSLNLRKTPSAVSSLPPPSPTAHKNFIKKRSGTFDFIETNSDSFKGSTSPVSGTDQKSTENLNSEKCSSQNMKRISSQELLAEQNMRIDRSSSSSDDCNLESTVIYRKKSLSSIKSGNRKDDEPELMKVFARRSLKLKDSETEAITQDILKITNAENKEEMIEEIKKNSKYDFSIMTRSRDSDKENEADSPKDERKKSLPTSDSVSDSLTSKSGNKNQIEFRKHNNETAELMQAQRMPKRLLDSNPVSINTTNNKPARPATIAVPENKTVRSGITQEQPKPTRPGGIIGTDIYRRAVSSNIPLLQSTNTNVENNNKEISNYKKDVSDSTPEKRFRNRTFPDSNNDSKGDDNIKAIGAKMESIQYSVDSSSLPKRPWNQIKSEDNLSVKESSTIPFRKSSLATPTETKVLTNNKSVNNDKMPVAASNPTTPEDDKVGKGSIANEVENGGTMSEADASPQFKGILQMRAEWERRAKQAMTK